jgi:hypothetical protein
MRMADWQPIETAPKDGSEVLLYRDDAGVILGRWIAPCDFLDDAELENHPDDRDDADWFGADFIAGYRITNDGLPTHWQPLPEPPTCAK